MEMDKWIFKISDILIPLNINMDIRIRIQIECGSKVDTSDQ